MYRLVYVIEEKTWRLTEGRGRVWVVPTAVDNSGEGACHIVEWERGYSSDRTISHHDYLILNISLGDKERL